RRLVAHMVFGPVVADEDHQCHLLRSSLTHLEPEDTRRRTNGSVLVLARHPISASSDLTEPAGARSSRRDQRSSQSEAVLTGQRLDDQPRADKNSNSTTPR